MPTSATGVTVADIRGMLAGIASLTYLRSTGLLVIEDDIILENILAAEDMLGTQLDLPLAVKEVRCIHEQRDPEEPGVIVKPAIDKPRNWFEQDRWGAIGLPVLPVREILSVRVYPSGWSSASYEVPLDRIRPDRKGFQIASWGLAIGGITGYAWSGGSVGAPLGLMLTNDGRSMPGGIEVIYRAGLSAYQIEQTPLLKTLTRLQALILTLTFYQAFLGGGAQKEMGGSDGQTNSVELAQRHYGGPLAGEILNLRKSYNELLSVARVKTGSAIATVWV